MKRNDTKIRMCTLMMDRLRASSTIGLAAGLWIGLGGLVTPAAGQNDCVNPTLLFEQDALLTNALEVEDNIRFMVFTGGGFGMSDVSDPTSPVVLGGYTTGNFLDFSPLGGIAVSGSTAYFPIQGNTNGLYIVNVSNPSSPVVRSVFDTGNDIIYGVEIEGTTVFLALGSSGVLFLDVSNPSEPFVLAEYDTPGVVHKAIGVGTATYIADGVAGLGIVDTGSSPAIGLIDTPGTARDVVVVDGVAYVADGEGGLQIIDVRDASSPFLLGSFDTQGNAVKLDVVNGTAYVSVESFGLKIIDVTDPGSPILLGTTAYGRSDVVVVGDTAFVLDGASTQILDVSNSCDVVCPLDNDCPPDLNGDGSLNEFDVSAFLILYSQRDPRADFTCDGSFNFFDLSVWLGEFLGGCP